MTTEPKHTRGPWHHHDMEGATVCGPDHLTIANCDVHYRSAEENEANARMVIAAPDLQAALLGTLGLIRKAQERLCAYLEPDGSNDDREAMNDLLYMFDGPEQRQIEEAARAAIDKATA